MLYVARSRCTPTLSGINPSVGRVRCYARLGALLWWEPWKMRIPISIDSLFTKPEKRVSHRTRQHLGRPIVTKRPYDVTVAAAPFDPT
jgi:hypothetical protein